ncbi:hypothetical protein [Bradyrhizobium sp. CIR3A]|uniref:hypothetical protein n=1 Tax=Bradyrhizobium sp. CIR3A TaxID=2663838 RepID=UPI00160624A8|nr:hypothetical protein [Bradyrhizobium sp. CIR3A]MBB4264207.1 hypothetical protein [Bradyrhizobium sp. CIR3A]
MATLTTIERRSNIMASVLVTREISALAKHLSNTDHVSTDAAIACLNEVGGRSKGHSTFILERDPS